ncbi:septation protein A [methanotrophic endosymbiont of Bathymodiolus puteoserpentis (Logatchev)]|jgi:intracellular septation protein|uniref:septation protein A n=1 Tax=methanotrophic endosymbiont of Bathymodiolus puteoserpentis (Logatchev) TaxID=343235 RepID=UPI00086DA9C3|nr:septation protein A [methanotrophic endosymbiont of Bathymodiolus puteoserpentis (Logatchev)]SCN47698.1 intracellular septation protein A [methanotrophic endosymbiont of Bathymodiolus azoricus (Menez Gwen)]SHE21453.1 Probable intracellular septation protein [methanotrophic endosymbiont of Bathymodiolus puteoserpentis (Logatchev)]
MNKILFDFFPIVLFFIAYKNYDLYVATAVVIGATFVQVAYSWFKLRKVETMQWVTLGLMVVMGGATLYLQDEQFIKWKLTIIEWLFGAVLLGSQFIGKKTIMEKMMGANLELPKKVWSILNTVWALFFISIGVINIYVMFNYDTETWVDFKTFGVPALMAVFILLQLAFLYKYMPEPADSED